MNIIATASSDRSFARELRLQLVGWGFRPWSADSEEPLLAQLQESGADLILLDSAGPTGNAAKTTRALKAAPETKHTPILALIESRETPSPIFPSDSTTFGSKVTLLKNSNLTSCTRGFASCRGAFQNSIPKTSSASET